MARACRKAVETRRDVYARRCARCHGAKGEGGDEPKQSPLIGGRDPENPQAAEDSRQLLALRAYDLGLRKSCDAARPAGYAHAQPSLLAGGVSAPHERDHRREQRARRKDASADQDAQSRRLRAGYPARCR